MYNINITAVVMYLVMIFVVPFLTNVVLFRLILQTTLSSAWLRWPVSIFVSWWYSLAAGDLLSAPYYIREKLNIQPYATGMLLSAFLFSKLTQVATKRTGLVPVSFIVLSIFVSAFNIYDHYTLRWIANSATSMEKTVKKAGWNNGTFDVDVALAYLERPEDRSPNYQSGSLQISASLPELTPWMLSDKTSGTKNKVVIRASNYAGREDAGFETSETKECPSVEYERDGHKFKKFECRSSFEVYVVDGSNHGFRILCWDEKCLASLCSYSFCQAMEFDKAFLPEFDNLRLKVDAFMQKIRVNAPEKASR